MMNRVSIILFLIAVSLSAKCHDIRVAQFTVKVENGQMVCEGRIDKEDFEEALGRVVSEETIDSYLKSHLAFKFNEDNISFSLESYELKKSVISLRFILETDINNPTDVEIFNTILSEEIDGHDNIMRFVLHEKTRAFRLNRNRQTVSFNY